MKKVRHRMTSLFLVCPPITCIIGLMVKCAWIGTSDINNPPLPSYGWVIVILSLSLIIWFCFSKKDLFFQRAHVQSTRRSNQEKTRPPTHWTSDPIKTNTAPQYSCHEQNSLSPTIYEDLWFLNFLMQFKNKHFFDVENVFMMWERDSASAKIDDCNW